MNRADRSVILAVDGGNSKTDVALVGSDGAVLAARRGPTVSHQRIGLEPGADRLAAIVGELAAEAGLRARMSRELRLPTADVGVFGLAGVDRPTDVRRLIAAFADRGLAADLEVINDARLPIRAGTRSGWGIALICGSGMNAAGISADGRVARLAALGEISGDWGGGMDVGKAGLGAAVRARDGRGPRTSLETLVPAAFGYARPIDLTWALELWQVGERELGRLCPVVFAAAQGGDAVAREIVDRLADELVAMAGAMIHRLHLVRSRPEVVLAGGVFAADDPAFEARIGKGIDRLAPGATVARTTARPVLGAALLGLDRARTLGRPVAADAEARLRVGLGDWVSDDRIAAAY